MGQQNTARRDLFLRAGRGGKHAETLLEGFSGILQVDGYDGYNILVRPDRRGGPVTLAYCWAHLRRRFYEIAAKGPAPIAQEALQRIQKLYKIEEDVAGSRRKSDALSAKRDPGLRSRP